MSGGDKHTSDRAPERLCSPASLLLLLLLGGLFSLILTLATLDSPADFWVRLALTLLFVEWSLVLTASLVCAICGRLAGRSDLGLSLWLPLMLAVVVASSSALVAILNRFPSPADPGWFVLRNSLIGLLFGFGIARYIVLQQSWKRQTAAESRRRLDALQARIRPHFLFNALNTIAELIHQRPQEAEEAVLDLSDLIRTGLSEARQHSLAQELELVRGYLRIESLRLGDRLKVDWQLAEALPLDIRIPALLIQPLVENAVVHGIAALTEGGVLSIRIERASFRRLRVVIDNPVPPGPRPTVPGHRLALDNIRQRLGLAYEERAGLKLEPGEQRFRAVLTLPLDQPPA